MGLDDVLDRIAARKEAGDLSPLRVDANGPDPTARAVAWTVGDPQLRPEHRTRIYEDLLANRERLRSADPRLVDLIFWSEHVESLFTTLKRGKLSTFHYVRALEATCRRCGYELLPVIGRMEDLGRAWSRRDYDRTVALLNAEMIEPEPEAPRSAGPSL